MRIYCYECHSLLQHCRKISAPNEIISEDVYECPRCKYEIVLWEKRTREKEQM